MYGASVQDGFFFLSWSLVSRLPQSQLIEIYRMLSSAPNTVPLSRNQIKSSQIQEHAVIRFSPASLHLLRDLKENIRLDFPRSGATERRIRNQSKRTHSIQNISTIHKSLVVVSPARDCHAIKWMNQNCVTMAGEKRFPFIRAMRFNQKFMIKLSSISSFRFAQQSKPKSLLIRVDVGDLSLAPLLRYLGETGN